LTNAHLENTLMTVGNPPREHHFVPQSWIRRFVDSDGQLYGYDREGGSVRAFSSKQIMKIRDLYTLDPDGIDDTSIETIDLQQVDDEGARTMSAILDGDRSLAIKERMAAFLAVQIMRDPQRLADYAPLVQAFLHLLFIEAHLSTDFAEFQTVFGDLVTRAEYDHLQGLGPQQAAMAVAELQIALKKKGGLAEVPFTDIIRAAGGRELLTQTLLVMEWTLITAPAHSFVLGDQGVLFEKGELGDRFAAPLSSGAALLLSLAKGTPPAEIASRPARSHEPDNFNFESAARTRRWFVGAKLRVDALKGQVSGAELPPR